MRRVLRSFTAVRVVTTEDDGLLEVERKVVTYYRRPLKDEELKSVRR